jgi:hypothetical protein
MVFVGVGVGDTGGHAGDCSEQTEPVAILKGPLLIITEFCIAQTVFDNDTLSMADLDVPEHSIH